MLVGYMRVSTAEQTMALQRDALRDAGCERVYDDTCSGSVTDRPGLARALDTLREGDALVVWKLDRIGRSLAHVVDLVGTLQKRGVGLKVLTGGIDTTSATGRLVFGIFATLSDDAERAMIRERTSAGGRQNRRPNWPAAEETRRWQTARNRRKCRLWPQIRSRHGTTLQHQPANGVAHCGKSSNGNLARDALK